MAIEDDPFLDNHLSKLPKALSSDISLAEDLLREKFGRATGTTEKRTLLLEYLNCISQWVHRECHFQRFNANNRRYTA